jgi:tetratricopeptide (TPR) repeat protein
LVELERLTLMGDFQNVIDIGSALMEKQWGDDTALIRFYLGQAYCRIGRPNDALQHLQGAREAFERVGDEWMAVDALDWEASALGLMEDSRAILLAGEALARCRRLDPKPPRTEARILGHMATMYVVAHSWGQAVSYYEAAVEAAGDVKDLLLLAKMHHDLGATYQRMQQPAKARHHFDKALALCSIESDLSAIYRLENDLGDLLLHQGQLDSAERHLRSALAGSAALPPDRRGRAYILANLGEVSLRRGQLGQARQQLVAALDAALSAASELGLDRRGRGYVLTNVAEFASRRGSRDEAQDSLSDEVIISNAPSDSPASGHVQMLLARLAEAEGETKLADRHFNTALRTFEQLQLPDRLRDCHMSFAEILERRGEIAESAHHWKAAAQIGRRAALGLSRHVEPALSSLVAN